MHALRLPHVQPIDIESARSAFDGFDASSLPSTRAFAGDRVDMDGQLPYGNPPPYGGFYNPLPPQLVQQEGYQQAVAPLPSPSIENLSDYGYDDPNRAGTSQQQSPRSRRRQSQGTEHVKHRRTRSGCYTCRQRRVKCDEKRPICDRCRKGKRDCQYPDPSQSSKSAGKTALKSKGESPSSASDAGDEVDDRTVLATIPDDDGTETPSSRSAQRTRQSSDASIRSKGKSATVKATRSEGASGTSQPPSRPSLSRANSRHSIRGNNINDNPRWSALPNDIKWYLRYHRKSVSIHHYCMKPDGSDFLKDTFLHIALGDEALLNAVVAFAAYFHTLEQENGHAQEFLKYYDRSVTLLREYIQQKGKWRVSTLLTILQLATIEECLGDWVNLINHQRAAHAIVTKLFNPETVLHDNTRRKIISWYMRFDLFSGIMSGGGASLDREWYTALSEFCKRQMRDRPNDLSALLEDWYATSGLLAIDVMNLFAHRAWGELTDNEFAEQVQNLQVGLAEYARDVETRFDDVANYVKAFPLAPPPSDNDFTDFRDPNFTYGGDLYSVNFVRADLWALQVHFKLQLARAQDRQPGQEVIDLAYKCCKMFEALEYYDDGNSSGTVLGVHAGLALAALIIPNDKKHINWFRRKLALVEQNGYNFPLPLRHRLGQKWKEDLMASWLPDGGAELTAPRRNVREFIESRAREQQPMSINSISGIFQSLTMQSPSAASTSEMVKLADPMDTLAGESSPDMA